MEAITHGGRATVERPQGLGDRGDPAYVSDVAVDALRQLGCRYLPLTPGSSFRGLHDSVVNHGGNQDPQVVLCVHEQIAVAAAHAYAKATGDVAVVALHDLVGLMNAQMALYNAWCDRAALVVLGGGGPLDPRDRRPIDWLHSANSQAELVRPFTKTDDEPLSAEGLIDALARAHRMARSVPTGPTYVTLDEELQEQSYGGGPLPDRATAQGDALPVPMPAPDDVSRAATWLLEAARPVVIAGRVGLDPASTPVLVELAELVGAACVDERNLTTFPTDHELNLTGDDQVIADADVRLAVELSDVRATLWRAGNPSEGRLITASLDELWPRTWTNAGRSQPPADLALVAPGLVAVSAVLQEVRTQLAREDEAARTRRSARRQQLARQHERLRADQRDAVDERWDHVPIAPGRLVAEVWQSVKHLPWLLALRNTRSWPEGIWRFEGAGRYLGHSGGGGVGYGPGAMVGAALAARDRDEVAVAIIGDGDLIMGPGALWTAVHHRLPLLVVVNDNHSFYNDEAHQDRMAIARRRPAENAGIGTRMEDPDIDFVDLARSFGAWASGPVHDPSQLGATLDQAVEIVAAGDVALVHVITSPT